MDKNKILEESLESFKNEIKLWMQDSTSFNKDQKSEIEELMKHVYYTLNDFRKIIKEN